MAINYFVQYPCRVRALASDRDLLRMKKARRAARASIRIALRDPNFTTDMADFEYATEAQLLERNTAFPLHAEIADLLAEAAPLDALSKHCQNCPANLRGTAFGCGGAIDDPITKETQRWLVSRLPDDLDTEAGQTLLSTLKDLHLDGIGAEATRLRNAIHTAKQPVSRTWGRFWRKKTRISSSQVLHMLIGEGPLSPMHTQIVCRLLGFLNDELKPEFRIDNFAAASDTPGIIQFKLFLAAATFAGSNNHHLFVEA